MSYTGISDFLYLISFCLVNLVMHFKEEVMTRPRNQQVSLASTPYYHCIGRCVRRAFLCGEDPLSGRSFEHRRSWVIERLALLSEVFAIDLCAYAVMSNHYHLVVRIRADQANGWDDREVASRWMKIFTGPPIVHNWLAGQSPDDATAARAQQEVAKWRERLCDLSWFMRCLNEHIAKRANEEDSCIPPDAWLRYMRPRVNSRLAAIGQRERLKDYAQATGRKWVRCSGEDMGINARGCPVLTW
ncbi:hypothetical protein S7S_12810 [Isoalcanivorax pacificus W11-5]|uniref:Transposase IS200-like domain-containing protein n=1 Tax=Isoalcanivorax pacificus W11-5 TaxID=391936 RepID=A0A0B4XL63_9GAMM|nr:hypothetical protein [Isoalcanivorax pacificus]AJD48974.1 hypothetical protein S7S_12810 [Isoalcanivorax pacificus W11-5]